MKNETHLNTTSFDIMKATAEGYKFLWHRRDVVMRLAFLPIVVKFICYFAVINLGLEQNFLRQGLILFPAYLLEGYLICTLIRLAVFTNEDLIQPPGSGAYEYYKQRGRDIQAGAILYTLIKMLAALILGLAYSGVPINQASTPPPPPPESTFEAFFAAMLMFIFFIWAFRLMWLNAPVTLGYSMRGYLKKVRGFSFSFHIFSVWVMCIIPFSLLAILFSDILSAIFQNDPEDPSEMFRIARMGVIAIMETLTSIVSNIAIALGVFWIMTGQNIQLRDQE